MQPQNASLPEALSELLQHHPRGVREAADALLEVLSPWELLYLRRRVAAIELDHRVFASWADLPADIIHEISDYLSLRDVLACRLVSREWKQTWLQDRVVTRFLNILDTRCPGMTDTHPWEAPKEDILLSTLNTCRSQRKRVKGLRGAFIPWFPQLPTSIGTSRSGMSMFQLSLNLQYSLSRAEGPTSLYSEGKTAWRLPGLRFGVDDIKTARRVVHKFPIDRRRPTPTVVLAALTGQMLVISASSTPAKLHILHLDREEWASITLPAPLYACFVQGESLVAVCRNKESFYWSWGGKCVDIEVKDDKLHAKPELLEARAMDGLPGVLFHPQRSDVLFLVHLYTRRRFEQPVEGKHIVTTVIIKYEQRGPGQPFIAQRRYERTTPHLLRSVADERPGVPPEFGRFNYISPSVRKINNQGSYSLFFHYFYFTLAGSSSTEHIRTLCFNVLNERFYSPELTLARPNRRSAWSRHQRIQFDNRIGIAEQVHIWGDEFFSLSWPGEGRCPQPPSLNSTRLFDEAVTMEDILEASEAEISAIRTPDDDDDVAGNVWNIGLFFWRIFADDDLLVILTDNGYYVVHCNGHKAEFDWLKGGLNQAVSLGLPEGAHDRYGVGDILVQMDALSQDLQDEQWEEVSDFDIDQ